ncbi:Putative zincin peptidase [Noviherbaspirillum humi]|uniref:Putative zincin peptidase n=1 Tax=Noviherbaspirillum humi TaxID=1688639 RepID=A0A239KKT9_9BURK|nr:metalloprotease family protein [Noviherbaspirillum humi]SNT18997.1 Putative zincin peptidase [Noviherbaspirillum humi]
MLFIPGKVIAAATFPGVVVHELAHQLFCRLFKVPVFEVCYFQFGDPAGFVVHGEPKKWPHHVLIGAGPFFINSLLGAFLSFPSALRIVEFNGAASVLDIALMWFGVSIAMHAIPSKSDAKSMWQSVSGKRASFLAKMIVAPIVGLIYLLAAGSVIWLDAIYGIGVCVLVPEILVAMLT